MERTAAYMMREAIQRYWEQTKIIRARIDQDKQLYNDATWRDMAASYNSQLMDGRNTALDEIYKARDEATAELRAWATLRGDQLTADAQLLTAGIKLTVEELSMMLEKYRDNYTMSRLIREYWHANADAAPAEFRFTALDADDDGKARIDSVERLAAAAASLIESIYRPDPTDPIKAALMDNIVAEWGNAYIEQARG